MISQRVRRWKISELVDRAVELWEGTGEFLRELARGNPTGDPGVGDQLDGRDESMDQGNRGVERKGK